MELIRESQSSSALCISLGKIDRGNGDYRCVSLKRGLLGPGQDVHRDDKDYQLIQRHVESGRCLAIVVSR
jgi:hypothetical protein